MAGAALGVFGQIPVERPGWGRTTPNAPSRVVVRWSTFGALGCGALAVSLRALQGTLGLVLGIWRGALVVFPALVIDVAVSDGVLSAIAAGSLRLTHFVPWRRKELLRTRRWLLKDGAWSDRRFSSGRLVIEAGFEIWVQ